MTTLDFRPDETEIGGLTPEGKIKKGSMSVAQRLDLIKQQLSDPFRNPEFDSELQREIATLSRQAPKPLDFQPVSRPSQATARAAEPRTLPLQEQELEERRFEAARKGWMSATGGVLKPGQTVNQAISEWAGIRDPRETRETAEAKHMAETGEFVPDDTVAYEATKALAGIGGFALAGPAGATAGELATRYASLKRRLDGAVKAGMNEDEADSILARELAAGITVDAAFNFGIPILGQWLAKISGKLALGEKLKAALEKAFGPEIALRESKIASRARIAGGIGPKTVVSAPSAGARRVFHGGPAELDGPLRLDMPGTNTLGGLRRHGVFVAPDEKTAARYAQMAGGQVYPMDAAVQKPLSMTAVAFEKLQSLVGKVDSGRALSESDDISLELLMRQFGVPYSPGVHPIAAIKGAGYDAIEKAAGRGGAEAELMVFDPAKVSHALRRTPRESAVHELSSRVANDYIPTPGQVRGEQGMTEMLVNKTFPAQFEAQEKALGEAAEGMRRELLYPGGQPSRQTLGQRIVGIADDTVKAVKARLRPAFQAADDLGVEIDLRPVAARAEAALKKDAAVPGGKLVARERSDLEELVRWIRSPQQPAPAAVIPGINPSGTVSAEAALDFISRQKEKLRSTTADWKPSEFYDTILNGVMRDADAAYMSAAQKAGKADVAAGLVKARNEYRVMMETVFDDAMKQALRKEAGGTPEDIGSFLWQNGKVSRIEQLNDLLGLAYREGKLTPSRVAKMQRDVTRGFLQEAVKDVDSAAKWTQTLNSEPRLADTWKVLTASPAGKELRDAMKVLEQAAQVVTSTNTKGAMLFNIPIGRAAAGGLGVSYVTGMIHPGMAVTGLSIAGMLKMMSVAYTHGDKGTINLLAKVLRARNVGTAAGIKALQTGLLPALERVAQKYDADDVFVAEGVEDMIEAPPGYGAVQIPGVSRER